MRTRNDGWTTVEDEIICDYIRAHSYLSGAKITEIIRADRPFGIKSCRYEGTSLYQHVVCMRRIGRAA